MAKNERNSTFLEIDENQLDVEWLGQSELYFTWAAKLADAVYELDQAQGEFELVQAEVESSIRSSPEKFNLDKITDKSVSATIIVQQEYQDQLDVVNKAKHKVGVLKAGVTALDQRKKALEKLVDLRLANYFSEPRAKTEGAREEMEMVRKKSIRGKARRRERE